MDHRYELERYKGMRSRYECPVCHHKGVFVRYIDTETGLYLSPEVGRCNREDKCGYHYTPKQYFDSHPTERPEANIIRHPKHITAPKSIDTIPKQYIIKSLGYASDFVRFLLSLFDTDVLESPTVVRLMSEYYLGCTKSGAVIFWQLDWHKRLRGGKIMQYNPETGKRIKNCDGVVNWVHSQLKKSGELPDSWELSQCLFGEHLLLRRPEATVCLVESEKTAIICSGVMPEYVWLATGGKQNFKAEKCECLKGRKVILYPDLGAFEDWKNKGETIARSVGFSLSVSDVLERIATPEDRESGFDIADYVIKQLRTGVRSNTGGQTRVLPLTWEEKILQQMSARNPAVLQLIDALDLVSSSTQMRLRTCVA